MYLRMQVCMYLFAYLHTPPTLLNYQMHSGPATQALTTNLQTCMFVLLYKSPQKCVLHFRDSKNRSQPGMSNIKSLRSGFSLTLEMHFGAPLWGKPRTKMHLQGS